MTLLNPMNPQPSLEGGYYKPNPYLAAPQVNAVDKVGTEGKVAPQQADLGISIDWLSLARNAYHSSDAWLMINLRAQWARNFAHYRSEHAPDAPILADVHKYRAKHFFPKSRTLVRAIQAAGAAAYFTSRDVVAIEAEDQDNPEQVEAASFIKELVNYRLTQTIPWYQIVLGALAETAVLGTVISHQSWTYREEEIVLSQEVDPVTGETVEYYDVKAAVDEPTVRIVPVENLRISPAADWTDPANSSPYIIELIPMYLGDVLAKINAPENDRTGEPAWINVGISALIASGNRDNLDPTRRARAGKSRIDPKANQTETVDEFRIVWIHRNIIRRGGKDWLFYTVGTTVLLSEPVPLAEVIPWADGKRDYVIGKMEVETDRPYSSSPTELISNLQKAYNELKNQRFDNVRQVLNRRYLYRGNNAVDARALVNNVPGGLIAITAPGPLDSHVAPLNTPDVTASSFQEEDRMALSIDDLSGTTSGSTVNSNRRLHETATGMNLMTEAGNQIREMELRTFTETWMERVLRQLVQLIAKYETDSTVIAISMKKAGLRRVLEGYFDHKFSVSVNVGMGAASPTQRMQRIQQAMVTVLELVPEAGAAVKGQEIAKEVFGAAGFDNGERFFDFASAKQQQDPKVELAQQELQLKQQIETAKAQIAQQKMQLDIEKAQAATQRAQLELQELQAQINLLVSKTATQNVTAIYEGTQAGAVIAQNPGLSPMVDKLLKSAGFQDHDAAPIVSDTNAPQTVTPPMRKNTSPGFPPKPPSPRAGIGRGSEGG